MKNVKFIERFAGLLSVIVAVIYLGTSLVLPTYSQALTEEDKKIFDSGARYTNSEARNCSLATADAPTPAAGNGVYIIGDSLTVGMDGAGLSAKLTEGGYMVTGVQATVGINIPNSLPKIDADRDKINIADKVIVALGTNDSRGITVATMNERIKSMVEKIKSVKSTVEIYWVNIHSATFSTTNANTAIRVQSTRLGYKIINWSNEAKNNPAKYEFDDLGVHPTGDGYAKMAGFVAQALGTSSGGAATGAGGCSCGPTDGGGDISGNLPDTVPEPHKALFTQAANKFGVNPQFLAAIFLSEQGNVWKAFNTTWASSPVGASGPFQFMPATWAAYKTDGNNDGRTDINNMYDGAYSAAKLLKAYNATAGAELGTLERPFVRNTLLQISASYNWGPGNVASKTTPSSPISAAPTETQEYISNIHALISSGFTRSGKPGYPDPVPTVAAGDPSAPPVAADGGAGCQSSNGDAIAAKAIELSWPESHGLEIKPEYADAIRQFNPSVRSDGADCGMFVSTVMRASGADPNYPVSGTSIQEAYVRAHPEKYDVVDSVGDVSELLPGDILIVNAGGGAGASGHTYIFVGPQPPNNYNEASASLDSRSANLGMAVLADDRGSYLRARLIN